MAVISFAGIASGIDSTSLIQAMLDQERKARVTPLQDKIKNWQDTNDTFSQLKDLLGKLQSAGAKFRELNGTALVKNAASSDETVLTASASNSAANGSYSLNVNALAKNATYTFKTTGSSYSSTSSVINSSINNGAAAANRTVTVETGQGGDKESVSVVLTNSSTLNDFVSQFNASSTKAIASVVNVGSSATPDYRIIINGSSSGAQKGNVAVTVGSEITSAGSGALNSNSVSQASDASFTISGIGSGAGDTITRSSNVISDVIPGLTLNLRDTGSATVNIQDDSAGTSTKIQDFVKAYNDVISFISDNNQVTRKESGADVTNIFGPLAGTSLDENLTSALRAGLSGASTSGRTVNILSDMGITTERDGTLKFDAATFETAMNQDPEGVRAITSSLGETLSATGGTIAQFTRFQGLIDTASNSNSSEITSAQNRINEEEKHLTDYQKSLTSQYARLESLMGQLNSQQQQLTALLPK